MTERISAAEFNRRFEIGRSGRGIAKSSRASVDSAEALAPARSGQFVAHPTMGPSPAGQRRYESKLGACLARRLTDEQVAGGIVSWIPEVSIPMGQADDGSSVRHRVDALAILEVRADGSFVGRFIEAKGRDLPAGRAKRAAVRRLYGTPIHVTKTGELP